MLSVFPRHLKQTSARCLQQCLIHKSQRILASKSIYSRGRYLHSTAPSNTRIVRSSSHHPDIPIPTNKSYVEFILEHCEQHGDKEAIADVTGKSFTYKDVSDLVKKCGSAFKRMGKNPKDVTALFMPNSAEYPVIFYGIQAAGGIATTVNAAFTVDELAYQLQDTCAKYLVTTQSLLGKAREAASKVKLPPDNVLDIDTLWNLVLSDDGSSLPNVHTTSTPSEDVISLPYSSGTTGYPKGVMLTDTNYISHALITSSDKFFFKGPDLPQMKVMALLPFFHAYGLAFVLGVHFYLGSKLFTMPQFDPEAFLKAIEDHKITDVPIVPPIALFLAKHPLVDKYNLSSLQSILCAAAPLSKEVEVILKKRFPNVTIIRQGYGLTETTAACIFNPKDKIKSGSIGVLLPNQEIIVKDVQTGELLGPMQDGEICVRGPTVTKGYLNKPDETAQTIDKDGWLHTGDIGYYDEDEYFYIVDRLKELIKYKAFQVAPAELEALLLTNKHITDAAVIGIPDEGAGELPRAFVVTKGDVTAEEIQQYVADKVAPHKKLRGGVEFVETIPRSASGKILRRHLRDKYLG